MGKSKVVKNESQEFVTGKDFKEESVFVQLGRVIDSYEMESVLPKEKFKPMTTIKTDDGGYYKVGLNEAKFMREMLVKIPTVARAEVLRDIQYNKGFGEFKTAIKTYAAQTRVKL